MLSRNSGTAMILLSSEANSDAKRWSGAKRWSRPGLAILAAGFVLFTLACFRWQGCDSGCGDGSAYLYIAEKYRTTGSWQTVYADGRLYGYPVFLNLIYWVFPFSNQDLSFVVCLMQTALYLSVSALLYRTLRRLYPAVDFRFVPAALFCNLLLAPYLALTMTDGLSVALNLTTVLLAVLVWDSSLRRQWLLGALMASCVGGVLGYSVMIRAADLFMIPPVAVFLALSLAGRARRNVGFWVLVALAVSLGFVAAVLPQAVFNFNAFGKLTFLPVMDFAEIQSYWGKIDLKYTTSAIGEPKGLNYVNPWFKGPAIPYWYLHHAARGPKTFFMHIFGALDFDYFFPYVQEWDPVYRPALFAFSQSVLFWGLVGLVDSFRSAHACRAEGEAALAQAWVFPVSATALIASWCAIHGATAMENRFALPLVTLLLPLAVRAVGQRVARPPAMRASYVLFLLYLPLAWHWSHFLLKTRSYQHL